MSRGFVEMEYAVIRTMNRMTTGVKIPRTFVILSKSRNVTAMISRAQNSAPAQDGIPNC